MYTWELIVTDATGHTFGFDYVAKTRSDAIAEFKKRCRRNGITNFKHIKILEVSRLDVVESP